MNLPFILRRDHDALILAIQSNCDSRMETIEALKEVISAKDQQIQAFIDLMVNPKCNDYTKKDPPKGNMVSFPNNRSGWRARAEAASEASIPVAPDSAAKLEQRVKDQGGII